MRRRERAGWLAIALLLIVLATAPTTGCSFNPRTPPPRVAQAEEVVEPEPWGAPKRGAADTAGELLVVFLFVGAVLGAAALPFLLL